MRKSQLCTCATRGAGNHFALFFITTVGTATLSLPVRSGREKQKEKKKTAGPGSSRRASAVRDIIIISAFHNTRLWLTTTPSSSRSFEWPRAKDPARRRAKEKAAITRSETFPFRSAFPRFPHDERVPPFFFWKVSCCACVPRLSSSSASCGVSLLRGGWNIFLAHAISYLISCGALDVLRLRRCFAKSLMNKSKQMLYIFFFPLRPSRREKTRSAASIAIITPVPHYIKIASLHSF